MPKGIPNKRYTPEFKVMVVETMRKEKSSYCEAARQFEVSSDTRLASWERIYLAEGPKGLAVERRGRACAADGTQKSRPAKLPPKELIDYLNYYNNRRIKANRKGLPPALHRQQALSAA